jgi:short-subunit dehydrogenase
MLDLQGKKALITGAAHGIGRAVALALAREGAALFLIDIDEIGLMATAREAEAAGATVKTRVCDVGDPAQVSATVDAVIADWGALNILINNAGIAYYGPVGMMPAGLADRILAVNLLAPVQFVRELLPVLNREPQAHIVNICSLFGLISMRKGVAYQTSKFGLLGFTMGLRIEARRQGFGVSAICPGFVQTGLLDSFVSPGVPSQQRHRVPGWVSTTPERVATATLHAIRRDKAIVVMPRTARLMWRLTRLAPGLVDWLMCEGWRKKPGPG